MKQAMTLFVLFFLIAGGCDKINPPGPSNGDSNGGGGDEGPVTVVKKEAYEDNKLKKEYEALKGKDGKFVKNGKYREFYRDGKQVRVEGKYSQDKKSGTWTHFDEEGTKTHTEDYKDGVLEGYKITFYPSGKPKLKLRYEGGKVNYCKEYYENGNEKSAGYMVGDLRDGEWLFYDEKGTLDKKEEYKDGVLIIQKANLRQISENEKKVLNALRELAAGQQMFKSNVHVDQDQNGEGEYGFFPELAGTSKCRSADGLNGPSTSNSPYIESKYIRSRDDKGVVKYAGYCLRIYLPGPSKAMTAAKIPPGGNPAVAKFQELYFCIYAYPINYGVTGKRTFFLNQGYFEDEKRTIWTTKNEKARYTEKKPPAPTAIFDIDDPARAQNLMAELGTIETNPNPTDGETWIPVR